MFYVFYFPFQRRPLSQTVRFFNKQDYGLPGQDGEIKRVREPQDDGEGQGHHQHGHIQPLNIRLYSPA